MRRGRCLGSRIVRVGQSPEVRPSIGRPELHPLRPRIRILLVVFSENVTQTAVVTRASNWCPGKLTLMGLSLGYVVKLKQASELLGGGLGGTGSSVCHLH